MRFAIFALTFVAFAGCSSSTDAPATADRSTDRCTPGAQIACACPGGAAGAQVCADDADHLGPCECPEAGAADASFDVPLDEDEGADASTAEDVSVDEPADVDAEDAIPDATADTLLDVAEDVAIDARDAGLVCPGVKATQLACGTCSNICCDEKNAMPCHGLGCNKTEAVFYCTCPPADAGANACLPAAACAAGFLNCDGLWANGCEHKEDPSLRGFCP
jgi:hypothetical protein